MAPGEVLPSIYSYQMMDSSLVDFVILEKKFFSAYVLCFMSRCSRREREAEQTQGGHKTAETEDQAIKRFGNVIIT